MFKQGDVVEVKFSSVWSEICEVVHQVVRDGELRYQVWYPFNGSSYKYFTEVKASAMKITNYKPRGIYGNF